MDADKKFVRGFFALIAWALTTGEVIYTLIIREWFWAAMLGGAIVGTAIHLALKRA